MSLPTVAGTQETVASAASNLDPNTWLARLQPTIWLPKAGEAGVAGFTFQYDGDAESNLQAEITDHWLEDNSAVQDHIAVKPFRITLKGITGEVFLPSPKVGLIGSLNSISSTLSQVPAYFGGYTPQAQQKLLNAISQAQSIQTQLVQSAAKINNLLRLLPGSSAAISKQQQIYGQLKSLAGSQQTFKVVTPFEVYNNMALESLHCLQPGETKFWTEFTVVLKQIRMTSVQSIPNLLARGAGRRATMSAPTVDQGAQKGTGSSIAFAMSGIKPFIP